MFNENGNITFDFLVNQMEVLTEMARPNKAMEELGIAGDAYKRAFIDMSKIMASGKYKGEPLLNSDGEEIPGLPIQDRYLKYALMTLLDADRSFNKNVEFQGQFTEKNFNNMIAGEATRYLKQMSQRDGEDYLSSQKDSHARMRKAVVLLVKNNSEYVLSPQFYEDMTNPQNLSNFMVQKRSGDTSYSANLEQRAEEKYNLPFEQILKIKSDARDLVSKLNNLSGYKKQSETRKERYGHASKFSTKKEEVGDNLMTNYEEILRVITNFQTLEQYIKGINSQLGQEFEENPRELPNAIASVLKDKYKIILPKSVIVSLIQLPENYLQDIYDHFEAFDETGITMEIFQQELEDLKSFMEEFENSGISEHPVLDMIEKELFALIDAESAETFPGFNEENIQRVLTSHADFEKFSRWYNSIYKVDQDYAFQAAREKESEEKLKSAPDEDHSPLRPEELRAVRNWKSKEQKIKTSNIDDIDDDDYMSSKIKDAKNQTPKETHKVSDDWETDYNPSAYDEDEDEESYVSQYMTEQVRKDSFNKPKGQFVDRGFKKVKNYHQWLMRNL